MPTFNGTPFNDNNTNNHPQVAGGNLADLVQGLQGSDILFGGNGNDTLYGGNSSDTGAGLAGDGSDRLSGGNGNDSVYGGLGNDSMNGDAGSDRLFGGNGNDTLYGGTENDTIQGGGNNDQLYGDGGTDTVYGNAGNDTFFTNAAEAADDRGGDVVSGTPDSYIEKRGEGIDTVVSNVPTFYLILPTDKIQTWETTTSTELEVLILAENSRATAGFGNGFSNTIQGNSRNNRLGGGGGNDKLLGNGGNDALLGGDGNDNLLGGIGNDLLNGGNGDDFLQGFGGGTNEQDTLTGGTGRDRFVLGDASGLFYNRAGGGDRAIITDFVRNQDRIQLKGSARDYVVRSSSPTSLNRGSVIFMRSPSGNLDLVAEVRGVTGLSLTDASVFAFV